ncbi:phospholipase domain-containing protein [Cupriavidus basilensis]
MRCTRRPRQDAGSAALHLSSTSRRPGRGGVHVYDRLRLERLPRRCTVAAGKRRGGEDSAGTRAPTAAAMDLWVLGPNGWHRRISPGPRAQCPHRRSRSSTTSPRKACASPCATMRDQPCTFMLAANA